MRVAMFSWESLHSISIGGLGVHVTELAAGLERRGHEIHVFTRRGPDQSHYDRIDGVHYHRIDHGIDYNFVECMDWMCKAMAHRFYEVTKMVGKFELAHAHDWMTGNVLKYISDGFGTPGVLTMHSTEYSRDGNVLHDGFARWIRDTEAAACNHAKVVISVSGFLADEIQRIYGISHSKIHVVPNGTAYHHFDGFLEPGPVKARYGIAPLDSVIFAPGRLTVQKGMDLLVDAIPQVLGYFPSAKFIIAGEGPEKESLINQVNNLGVGHAVRFLGNLSRGEYSELLRSVDIMALPSRNEPFGIVALEAWSAGKPVVATLAGGPREYIWHDVNGFLVDTNAGGLAHGIGSLLADHDHCRALGRNGRVAVEDKYNWNTVAAYTEGVYNYSLN